MAKYLINGIWQYGEISMAKEISGNQAAARAVC